MQQTGRLTAPAARPALGSSSISVVLPAYNEAAIIEHSVLNVDIVLRALTNEYEIIVLDDGSRDDPQAVLLALAEAQPDLPLRVVQHQQNQGYGAALASGLLHNRRQEPRQWYDRPR